MQLDVARTEYHRVRITRAAANLRKRHFAVQCFEKGSDAAEFFFSSVAPGERIGHGGSDTIRQIGIMDRLRNGTYQLLDRAKFGHSYEEQLAIRRATLSADVFIASANAVAIDGALVNIDGDGNRVSAIGFGPRRVFLFVGRNKLCENLESSISRARNVASTALAIQLGKQTPCVKTGRCHDCSSPERICNNLSIIERCNPPSRISVLLINEDLGL